jgi:hypothetical protein
MNTEMNTEIEFVYLNWRGETRVRRVRPGGIRFMETPHHPEMQWILRAVDLDKGEMRSFALRDCDFTSSGIEAFKLAQTKEIQS